MQEQENDLKKRIRTLRHIALDIQSEAELQSKRLIVAESEFSKAINNIFRSVGKIRNVKNVKFSHTFYIFVFAIIFFIGIWFLL